jgi:hypothetical protein
MSRETDSAERPRRQWVAARHLAACAGALALLLAACGSDDGATEREPDVNPVEAVMAIDDVRVAGVPLATAPAGASPPAFDADPAAAAAAPAVPAPRGTDPAAPRPLAVLQPGAPLVVDLEVTNATVGSEVGLVWYAPDGREAWRQKQAVGDAPRLAFTADTRRWPSGLYRGELRYGRVPVHQFAVQVGTPAPRVIVRERFPGQPLGAAAAGQAVSGQEASRAAAAGSSAGSSDSAAGREAAAAREAAATPSAPRARDEAAAASEPTDAAPTEVLPVEEGAPVERLPPDDPNMVAPEGSPGPAPEAPPEDEGDEADDEPPPRRAS